MRSLTERALFSGLAVLIASSAAFASDVRVAIDLPESTYIRGELDPVKDLIVDVTISNRSEWPVSLPAPELSPVSGTEFEIDLIGAPFCSPEDDTVAARTRISRDPAREPIRSQAPRPGLTLEPGRSETFQVSVGKHYRIQAAGRYEIVCVHEGQRSNAATFEVMPLKRVDVVPSVLMTNLYDYERGEAEYPFMFYVTPSFGRYDQILLLRRTGGGLESHPIAEIAPGVMPQIAIDGSKVGLLVPHRNAPGITRVFTIDMAGTSIEAEVEEFAHEPDARMSLVAGGDGRFTAR